MLRGTSIRFRDTSAQDRLLPPPSLWQRLRRHWVWVVAVIAALVALALLRPLVARMITIHRSVSAARISISTVERGPLAPVVQLQAEVIPIADTIVRAPMGGRLHLRARAGQAVAGGQVIATIEIGEAGDAPARAWEGMSEGTRDPVRRAHLEDARLRPARLRQQIESLPVRAPVAGRIGSTYAANRTRVSEGAPLLQMLDPVELGLALQPGVLRSASLAIGMPVDLNLPGQSWTAQISSVPRQPDGRFSVRVQLPCGATALPVMHQRLTVTVHLQRRNNVLLVPRGPWYEQGAGHSVYVIRDNIATRQAIRTGTAAGDRVEILSGLRADDRVVTSGGENFHAEPAVSIVE